VTSHPIKQGDKNAADAAAVDAMRSSLMEVDFTGHVVLDKGAKDKAPMLHAGRALHSFPDCMLTVYRTGVPYTGAEAEAWCLLIHADASPSLSLYRCTCIHTRAEEGTCIMTLRKAAASVHSARVHRCTMIKQ